MPGRWLSLLLCSAVVHALPYHKITRPEDEVESEESRRVLGSSVVTSVSVIMDLGNGTKKYIADALGKPVPKPTAGTAVGSPPSLLSPDRYEFYTFDETGDLVKRLMTLEEIQSIIAGGEGETLIQQKPSYYHQSLPPEIQPPLSGPIDEGNVDELIEDAMGEYSSPVLGVREVVANVQNVLKNELEAKKNTTPITATLPPASIDSSAEWGSFIPTAQFSSGSSEFTTSLKPTKITTKPPSTTSRRPSTTTKSPPTTNKRPATTTKSPSTTSRRPVTSTKRPVSTSSKPTTTNNKPTLFHNQILSSNKKPLTSSTKPVTSTTKYRPSENISVTKAPSSTTEKAQSSFHPSNTGSSQTSYSSLKTSAIPETTYIKISQSTPSIATEKPFKSTINQQGSVSSQNGGKDEPNKIPISAFTSSDLTVIKDVINNTISSAAQNATASPQSFAILSTSTPSTITTKPGHYTTLQSTSNAITVVTSKTGESTLPPLEVLLELIQSTQSEDSETIPSTIANNEIANDKQDENAETTYYSNITPNYDVPSLTAMESNIMPKVSNTTNKISTSTNIPSNLSTLNANEATNSNQSPVTLKTPFTSSGNKSQTATYDSNEQALSNLKISSSETNNSKKPVKVNTPDTTEKNDFINNGPFSTVLEEQSTIKYTDYPFADSDSISNVHKKAQHADSSHSTEFYETTSIENDKTIENTPQYTHPETQTITLYGAPQDELDITAELADSVSSVLSQVAPEIGTTIVAPQDEPTTVDKSTLYYTLLGETETQTKDTFHKVSTLSNQNQNNFLKIASSYSNTESTNTDQPDSTTTNNISEESTMLLVSTSEGKQDNKIKTKFNIQNKAEVRPENIVKENGETLKLGIKSNSDNYSYSTTIGRTTANAKFSETESTEAMTTDLLDSTTDESELRFAQTERETASANKKYVIETGNENIKKDVSDTGNVNQDNDEEYQPLFTTLQYIGTATRFLDFTTTYRPIINDKIPSASHVKGTQVKYIDEDGNINLTTENDADTTVTVQTRNAQNSTTISEEAEENVSDATTAEISTFGTDISDVTTLRILSKISENGDGDDITTVAQNLNDPEKIEGTTGNVLLKDSLNIDQQEDDASTLEFLTTTEYEDTTIERGSESQTQKSSVGNSSVLLKQNAIHIVIVNVTENPNSDTYNSSSDSATENKTDPTTLSTESVSAISGSNVASDLKDENPVTTVKIPVDKLTTDALWTAISTLAQNETKITSTDSSSSTLGTTQNITVHPLRIGSANENTSVGIFPNLPPPYSAVDLYPAPEENLGLESTTINLDTDVKDFSALCNELAFKLWGSLSSKGLAATRSLVLSPFASTALLAMVFLGARGSTSGQMNDILRLDEMVTFNPHQVFRNVTESVVLVRNPGIATAAFVRELFSDKVKGKLLDFYKERAQQFYDGHVEEVGFSAIGDILKRRTNMLIKRQTFNKVPEYLRNTNFNLRPPLAAFSANIFQDLLVDPATPTHIHVRTPMVCGKDGKLTTFVLDVSDSEAKFDLMTNFPNTKTRHRHFHDLETACHKASIEGRDGEMYFTVTPSTRQRRLVPIPAAVWRSGFLAGYDPKLDATAVAIGTGVEDDSLVSTIFVLPGQQGQVAPGDGLMRLEKRLIKSSHTKGVWSKLLRSLLFRPGLEVQIPRFSHRSLVNITGPLQRMGLKDLFAEGRADLRGLNGLASDLHLSDIVQVNTFGTCGEETRDSRHHVEIFPSPPHRSSRDDEMEDMADSDNIPLALRPRQARLPDSPRLRFDRPFLYFVRHNPTGFLLYMGRFNPRLIH